MDGEIKGMADMLVPWYVKNCYCVHYFAQSDVI